LPIPSENGDAKKEMENDAEKASVLVEDRDGDAVPSSKSTEDKDVEGGGAEIGPAAQASRLDFIKKVYGTHTFLIHVLIGILLAWAYPPLGGKYLAPHITAKWVAVIFIFVMAGLGLKTEEFANAFKQFRFNLTVQIFNFMAVSGLVFGVSRFLLTFNLIAKNLADGMVICSCLPMTINMVLVMTKSAGGEEAAAVFNAAFGNMLGVFITPLLILMYLGEETSMKLGPVFFKLGVRVLVPITVGQLLKNFVPPVKSFVTEHKPKFKKLQEWALVFIIYTVFCHTFLGEVETTAVDALIMVIIQCALLCLVMGIAWIFLKFSFPNSPKLRVMGLFGCSHKTVAMGIPLINAIYETDPNLAFYTLPLIVWHPMQAVIGSALSPSLNAFVKREEARLNLGKDQE